MIWLIGVHDLRASARIKLGLQVSSKPGLVCKGTREIARLRRHIPNRGMSRSPTRVFVRSSGGSLLAPPSSLPQASHQVALNEGPTPLSTLGTHGPLLNLKWKLMGGGYTMQEKNMQVPQSYWNREITPAEGMNRHPIESCLRNLLVPYASRTIEVPMLQSSK